MNPRPVFDHTPDATTMTEPDAVKANAGSLVQRSCEGSTMTQCIATADGAILAASLHEPAADGMHRAAALYGASTARGPV